MSADWYPGIRTFCTHWNHAPMLQQTFEALEREFNENSDACIDAAKAIVECACRVIIDNLDKPTSPVKPAEENPPFGAWVSAAVRVLELSEIRDDAFKKLISQHHKLTTTLGDLRNKAGTMSHGKDGFIAKLSIHHRRAALLAADAIVTFLHEAYLECQLDAVLSKEPYDARRLHGGARRLDPREWRCRKQRHPIAQGHARGRQPVQEQHLRYSPHRAGGLARSACDAQSDGNPVGRRCAG